MRPGSPCVLQTRFGDARRHTQRRRPLTRDPDPGRRWRPRLRRPGPGGRRRQPAPVLRAVGRRAFRVVVDGRDAPSRPGRKAHNCCLSGGTVCHPKGRSAAKDARSALTRRPALRYLRRTCPRHRATRTCPQSGAPRHRQFRSHLALSAPRVDQTITTQPTHTRCRRARKTPDASRIRIQPTPATPDGRIPRRHPARRLSSSRSAGGGRAPSSCGRRSSISSTSASPAV